MSRSRAVSPAIFRIIFACGLCLLAVTFSVEAKTAWFGPSVGVGSDVRAAKALPADMLRVIEHGIPVPDPIHPQIPFAVLAAYVALDPLPKVLSARFEVPAGHLPFSLSACFSPHIFFRPPPVLS